MFLRRELIAALLASCGACAAWSRAADNEAKPQGLAPQEFAQTLALIRPQPGEADWMDIAWEIDVWEARQRAAAEGKPIFFLTGGGKSPLGDC